MSIRIAIPVPTSGDLAYNKANWQAYADSVGETGADPILFPLDLSRRQAIDLAATCEAIVLPGSPADVEPHSYGQAREEATAPPDVAREELDRLLIEHAFATRKPLLCICFGVQILNVLQGGTLVQDLAVMPVNHSAGKSVAVAHSVSIVPDSLLGRIVDRDEAPEIEGFLRLPINSSHHQAIGIPGSGLRISARCPQDGVVEAVEGEDCVGTAFSHFLLGVQWHPERSTGPSPTSRAIFGRIAEEARAWGATAGR